MFQSRTICGTLDECQALSAQIKASELLQYQREYPNANGTFTIDFLIVVPVDAQDTDIDIEESDAWLDELNADYSASRGV